MARSDSKQRARILAAAADVFAAEGWKGATIREVSRRAGVNSALIYYYFENKHTLFEEAVRAVLAGFLDQLKQRSRPFRGARDRIAFLVNGVYEFYSAHPERMRLVSTAVILHKDVFSRVIGSLLQGGLPFPLAVLQEGVRRGELKPMHPVEGWWSIVGLCFFSLHMREMIAHMEGRSLPFRLPDMKRRRQQIVDLLMNGLAADTRRETARRTRSPR